MSPPPEYFYLATFVYSFQARRLSGICCKVCNKCVFKKLPIAILYTGRARSSKETRTFIEQALKAKITTPEDSCKLGIEALNNLRNKNIIVMDIRIVWSRFNEFVQFLCVESTYSSTIFAHRVS